MNIYLDCGFYAGLTLNRYLQAQVVDKTWTIYAFEPNKAIERREFPVDLIWSNEAVWITDGTVTFDIGGREDSSCIEGTAGHTEPEKITVPCIDFSTFVAELPEAYIICSMDIEGAEFKVLQKMLKDHTIDKINFLEIEFHHRLMTDYDDKDASKLITQIRQRGVDIRLKEVLV